MKSILAALVLLPTLSFAQIPALTGKVSCKITSINGRFSSYLPPVVGNKIVIDTDQNEITHLSFTGRTMIPVSEPLVKQATPDYAKSVVTFLVDESTPVGGLGSLLVTVNRVGSPAGGYDELHGAIQRVTRDRGFDRMLFAEAALKCVQL